MVCAYRLSVSSRRAHKVMGSLQRLQRWTGLVGGGVRWCGFGSAKYCANWLGSRGEKGEKGNPKRRGLLEGKRIAG